MKTYSIEEKRVFLKEFLGIPPEDLTLSTLTSYISNRIVEGKGLYAQKLAPSDNFILKKGTLKCTQKNIKTNVGKYIFNAVCLEGPFQGKLEYTNEIMNTKGFNVLNAAISAGCTSHLIDTTMYMEYATKLVWLAYTVSDMVIPGMSMELVGLSDDLVKLKKELVEKNKDAIENNDIVSFTENVENVMVKAYLAKHANNPALRLYTTGGKPNITNSLKKCNIMTGVNRDKMSADGDMQISTRSFSDGITAKELTIMANELVHGSASRAIETQDGGAIVKRLIAAFQASEVGAPGSDCKTKLLLKVRITERNAKECLYNYVMGVKGNLVKLTPENVVGLYGKEVKMRHILYCKSLPYCNMCCGDRFHDLGLEKIGISSTKIGSVIMYVAMKSMHDSSIKLLNIDPMKYFIDSKELAKSSKRNISA